jgi:ABC-type transport system involved in multi-copper enzyme maturation permease subunit
MFMFSNVVGFCAVFAASPTLSGDVESGTALALLARPLSRLEYVAGKWLGIAAVLAAYTFAAAAVELVVVNAVVGYLPPHPFELMLFVLGEGAVLLTLALLLSSRLSGMVGGVVALTLFGIAWIAGVVGGLGAAFDNEILENVGTVSALLLPTDGLWRGAIWSLEPAAVIAGTAAFAPATAGNPFDAPAPPSAAYLAWTLAWIAAVLGAAVASFRAREV